MDIVNLFARKKAENPSLPGGKVVRGHLIPRLPLGEYLAALQALKTLDEQALVQLVANLAGSGAPYVLGLVARFSGIPEKELREDPAIGLDGLVEILQAIFEVNGWGNVLAAVREALPQKPESRTTPTGSRA